MWPDWAITKALGDKISYKSSPNIWSLFGQFWKKTSILRTTAVATFWATFEQWWGTFIPIFGHTDSTSLHSEENSSRADVFLALKPPIRISWSHDKTKKITSVGRSAGYGQCDQIGRFIALGNFLKPVATINLPKLAKILGYFCKGVIIFHFSCEIIFGELL